MVNKAYTALVTGAIILVPFGALVIFSIESPNENSEIKTLLDAFWWSAVTVTTVFRNYNRWNISESIKHKILQKKN